MPENRPLTSSDSFDTIIIVCTCDEGYIKIPWVQMGTSPIISSNTDPGHISLHERAIYDPDNADAIEILRRINNGTARAYYLDYGEADPDVLHPVEDAPHAFHQFHNVHQFWPDDGYKIYDSLVTKGDLNEGADGNRHIEYDGGFVPTKPDAVGATIQHSLGNWSVFRASDTRFGFRIIIPASLGVTQTDANTYPDAIAFVKWLDSYRTQGVAIPDAFATTNAAFTGRRWRLPDDPNDATSRSFDLSFVSLANATIPGSQHIIMMTFEFLVHPDSGTALDININNLGEVVNAAFGTIPATGQTVEPPFGAADVATRTRRIESNDGNLFMAGGLALVQWTDPGFGTQREMPLSGFGRSINYDLLPVRQSGGRWASRPLERPRANLFYYDGDTDAEIWFEPGNLFVNFPGTDRIVEVHNRSDRMLTVGVEKNLNVPTRIMILRPNERLSIRATLDLNGESEYSVFSAPPRYLVRGGASLNVNSPNYLWTTGGVEFAFRPWFNNAHATERRDTDEFTFGTAASHNSGTQLTSGIVNSPHAVNVTHHGDLIFYEQTECEITGSGVLGGGHSSVLVRERNNVVSIFSRDWQPSLSGVGSHRTYTTAFIDECEPGDRYVSGLIYIRSGTTLSFTGSNLRINGISQIMRVAPRITI